MQNATFGDATPAAPDFWEGFEVIDVYSRAQAIEDGTLVDLSAHFPHIVRRFFKYHTACTATVWNLMEFAANDNPASDLAGVVGYVLLLAASAGKSSGGGSVVFFNVPFKDAAGKSYSRRLQLHIGPGDTREPVFTLMMHDED